VSRHVSPVPVDEETSTIESGRTVGTIGTKVPPTRKWREGLGGWRASALVSRHPFLWHRSPVDKGREQLPPSPACGLCLRGSPRRVGVPASGRKSLVFPSRKAGSPEDKPISTPALWPLSRAARRDRRELPGSRKLFRPGQSAGCFEGSSSSPCHGLEKGFGLADLDGLSGMSFPGVRPVLSAQHMSVAEEDSKPSYRRPAAPAGGNWVCMRPRNPY